MALASNRSAAAALTLLGALAVWPGVAAAQQASRTPIETAAAGAVTGELVPTQARGRCWTVRRCHVTRWSPFPWKRQWHTDVVRCCIGIVPGQPACNVTAHLRDNRRGPCPYGR